PRFERRRRGRPSGRPATRRRVTRENVTRRGRRRFGSSRRLGGLCAAGFDYRHRRRRHEGRAAGREHPGDRWRRRTPARRRDRRQMEALPLQGRNWMELSKLVKGVTANDVGNSIGTGNMDDLWQLNLDGQQITQKVAGSGFGQPRFSREAIAEFQIVTNMFDITQGRSAGIEIQAISKSGTNNLSGNVYGYFRDDSLNAPD